MNLGPARGLVGADARRSPSIVQRRAPRTGAEARVGVRPHSGVPPSILQHSRGADAARRPTEAITRIQIVDENEGDPGDQSTRAPAPKRQPQSASRRLARSGTDGGDRCAAVTRCVPRSDGRFSVRSVMGADYVVHTAGLTEAELQVHRDRLTLEVANPGGYGGAAALRQGPRMARFYAEDRAAGTLAVPRYYGLAQWGRPTRDETARGAPIDVAFVGRLSQVQRRACHAILHQFGCAVVPNHPDDRQWLADNALGPDACRMDAHGSLLAETAPGRACGVPKGPADMPGAILQLPCGFGKTVCAIYIICRVGRRAVFTVGQEEHMTKTAEAIGRFAPGARVGIVHRDRFEVEGRDIVVAMRNTILVRGYGARLFGSCGLWVDDEVQHEAAPWFSRMRHAMPAALRLGLSATPRRRDGLTPALSWILGAVAASAARDDTERVICRMLRYNGGRQRERTLRGGGLILENGKPALAVSRMITDLADDAQRSLLVSHEIVACLTRPWPRPRRRKIMVLSSRRGQLDTVRELVVALLLAASPVGFVAHRDPGDRRVRPTLIVHAGDRPRPHLANESDRPRRRPKRKRVAGTCEDDDDEAATGEPPRRQRSRVTKAYNEKRVSYTSRRRRRRDCPSGPDSGVSTSDGAPSLAGAETAQGPASKDDTIRVAGAVNCWDPSSLVTEGDLIEERPPAIHWERRGHAFPEGPGDGVPSPTTEAHAVTFPAVTKTATTTIFDLPPEMCAAIADRLVSADLVSWMLAGKRSPIGRAAKRVLARRAAARFSLGYLVGGMKPEEREGAKRCDVILATYAVAAENVDIVDLDTVFMISPRGDVEQSVGRGLRKHPDKNVPMAMYVVDPFSMFLPMAYKVAHFFKSQGYSVGWEDMDATPPAHPPPTPVPSSLRV